MGGAWESTSFAKNFVGTACLESTYLVYTTPTQFDYIPFVIRTAHMAGNIQPYTPKQEKFGSWIISKVGRWQTTVYELSGGRLWNTFLGGPVAILTVVGRKSGVVRKIPLLFLKHGDNVVMTASKGGMSKLPVWYHNVVAADTADIQIGSGKKTYRMREANEQEEATLWPLLEAMYPDYKEYRARTEGVREIPVLIFSPV
jgi:deazaflavin-dependent oxidoreductase (nitroreductase family)